MIQTVASDPFHPASVKNLQRFSAVLKDTPTDFILQSFVDTNVIIINHLPTLGLVIQVQSDMTAEGSQNYTVTTLLGRRDDPFPEVCARQIASILLDSSSDALSQNKRLLLFFGVKHNLWDSLTIQDIARHIRSNFLSHA